MYLLSLTIRDYRQNEAQDHYSRIVLMKEYGEIDREARLVAEAKMRRRVGYKDHASSSLGRYVYNFVKLRQFAAKQSSSVYSLEATDETNPPSARIRALELLGKVTEVAAFTERREQTVIHSSEAIKQQLMERLRSLHAIDITPIDALNTQDDAQTLLAELNAAESATASHSDIAEEAANIAEGEYADPTVPDTPILSWSPVARIYTMFHTNHVSNFITTLVIGTFYYKCDMSYATDDPHPYF